MTESVRGGWGAKRAFLRQFLRLIHRRVPIKVSSRAPRNGEARGHIIVLHGWGLDAGSLQNMAKALGEMCPHRQVWQLTYDTNWTKFDESARAILHELRAANADWNDTILVGYSMGGIVARSLVAQGFEARAVVALCSPHSGPLPYLLFPGPRSLSKNTAAMRALNQNPRDIAARPNLHCLAIKFRDTFGEHNHDGIVPLGSALGEDLGAIGSRHATHLRYAHGAFYDPHWRGKDPHFLPAALEAVVAIDENRAPDYSTTKLKGYSRIRPYSFKPPKPRAQKTPAKRGDILLFTDARGPNRLITWFTRSRFYHVGLYEGEGWIVEARPRGVVRRNLNGPDGDRCFVAFPFEKLMTNEQAEKALAWAQGEIGDGYAPFDVAAIVLERLFRWVKINYSTPDKYSCGEFVTKALREAGVDPFPNRLADRIVPSDFEKWL